MTLKIYGVAKSRTIRTLWMANELGLAFEHVELPFGAEGSRKPEYTRINPSGQVPFIDDDGLILSESLAINMYLARKHGGPLAPADAGEVGQVAMWTLFGATTLEPNAVAANSHGSSGPPERRDPALHAKALEALKAPLQRLEAALVKGGGYLVGGRFTVADLNLVGVMHYLRNNLQAIADKPAIRAWRDASLARPAARKSFALRGE